MKKFLLSLLFMGLFFPAYAADVNSLNVSDAANTARFPENMAPSALNNGARALEGIIARWDKDTNGSLVSTGSANAYVLAANRVISAYYDGLSFTFEANFANTGAATLIADGVSADAIVRPDGTALNSGDIPLNAKISVTHDGTNWQLAGVSGGSIPVGVVESYIGGTAPTGWVLGSGRTIGNAASGANERANADTEDLFTLLWDSWADGEAVVSTGRGANAAADFAANKTIKLPDLRGRTLVGLDNMGGTTASRMTTGGSGISGVTLGRAGGSQTHTLSVAQMPNHNHLYTRYAQLLGGLGSAGGGWAFSSNQNTSSEGSGSAHQNTQPSMIMAYIIKL